MKLTDFRLIYVYATCLLMMTPTVCLPQQMLCTEQICTHISTFSYPTVNTDSLIKTHTDMPFAYAVYTQAGIELTQTACDTLENKCVWRLLISAPISFSLGAQFINTLIPDGAKITAYNAAGTQRLGPYTSKDIRNNALLVADLPGDTMLIEYCEPLSATFRGHVVISKIGYGFRNIFNAPKLKTNSYGDTDVNCPEGDDYQNVKHSVCRITFLIDGISYLCSGAFINNARNDGTPYFLTANHCIDADSIAQTATVFFNYEHITCDDTLDAYKTLSGATLIAHDAGIDFSLLRFNTTPDSSMQVFYAGWNAGDYPPARSTCIHHPGGIEKKISLEFDSAYIYPSPSVWGGGVISPAYTHLMLHFDLGTTRPGSSGSPLFDQDKRIVGQLHGGDAFDDFFGRVAYAWDRYPGFERQLKHWLDPDNTDTLAIDGYAPPNIPDSRFTISTKYPCVNNAVHLYDNTVFSPVSWLWRFDPPTITYLAGTDSTSQDPIVQCNNPGTYSISLKTTNSEGESTRFLHDYMLADYDITTNYEITDGTSQCIYNTPVISLSGAETYSWHIGSTPFSSNIIIDSIQYNKLQVLLNTYMINDSIIPAPIIVIGQHGTCIDTADVSLNFRHPMNDHVENATELQYGINGPFSNLCSTIQTNESYPPITNCVSQLSWCNEYLTGEDIIEHTVWFKFTATNDSITFIRAHGFDTEIALYDAASAADILDGNFTILAANDDSSDTNPYSSIDTLMLTPGKTYWLQLDGSGGGTEGTCFIELLPAIITDTQPVIALPNFLVYPNPNDGSFSIAINGSNNQDVAITIFDNCGKQVHHATYTQSGADINIVLNNCTTGMYYMEIKTSDKVEIKKLLIR